MKIFIAFENDFYGEEFNVDGLEYLILLETDKIDIHEINGDENLINEYLNKNKKFVKLLTENEANQLGRDLIIGESIFVEDEYGNEIVEEIIDFNINDGIISE